MLRYQIADLRRGKPWERRGMEPGELKPTPELACAMVMSSCGKHKAHCRHIIVRCECMAQTWARPSRRYFNYDPLAVVSSLDEAIRVYKEHKEGKQ